MIGRIGLVIFYTFIFFVISTLVVTIVGMCIFGAIAGWTSWHSSEAMVAEWDPVAGVVLIVLAISVFLAILGVRSQEAQERAFEEGLKKERREAEMYARRARLHDKLRTKGIDEETLTELWEETKKWT